MGHEPNEDHLIYDGSASIDGHEAVVRLTTVESPVDADAAVSTGWTGIALLLDPPSFHLLEFMGSVEVKTDAFTVEAQVLDATPGSGILYLRSPGLASTNPAEPPAEPHTQSHPARRRHHRHGLSSSFPSRRTRGGRPLGGRGRGEAVHGLAFDLAEAS